jgi:hypothetical protein
VSSSLSMRVRVLFLTHCLTNMAPCLGRFRQHRLSCWQCLCKFLGHDAVLKSVSSLYVNSYLYNLEFSISLTYRIPIFHFLSKHCIVLSLFLFTCHRLVHFRTSRWQVKINGGSNNSLPLHEARACYIMFYLNRITTCSIGCTSSFKILRKYIHLHM